MTTREKEFYKNVIINEENKSRVAKALQSKGIEKHILIKEKLLPWSSNPYIEYEKIASTYRYDKRIRYTLFKYISYLEEFYRAIILDNYYNMVQQDFWIKGVKKNLNKFENNLNDALEHLGFAELLEQCRKLPEKIRDKCGFSNIQHLEQNFNALRELRNAVMHNKFLLLYRGYDICYVQGVDNNKSGTLKANILNLVQFLPEEVGRQCIEDIHACKEKKDKPKDKDFKWDLPEQVLVILDESR